MAFTVNINDQSYNWDKNTLGVCLEQIAASPKIQATFDFALKFDGFLQKMLQDIKVQILESDDKELITLYRRAIRNYNSIYPETQVDPAPLYNKHYQKPPFLISNTDLTLDIQESKVIVTTELKMKRNSSDASLVLDAKEHLVLEVFLNGALLPKTRYFLTDHEIIICNLSEDDNFHVKVVSEINPFDNKTGEGLYRCGKWLTTQCESEGARCIFPTLDRPDVLSVYSTTIIADPICYPCRISNGNLVSESLEKDGRCKIVWEDPFPKPSYLFAAVLGDFGILKDQFITKSGKNVTLEVFMEKGKEQRATYSLFALKQAMKYEETHFDREYDLDSLKMVAMPEFNMGAMENKGLMIFNEGCILSDSTCATDMDYCNVSNIISHEYCHNWSGNRVTVRNWFELALKEAFTDFRCSKFSEWLFGDDFVRPWEARHIRENQFPQDASARAHPIQVESYMTSGEIYDSTTYVKGREVFRMLQTILDSKEKDGFKMAQNAYFDRYDGQAVTFHKLLKVLNEVSNTDLTQFKRWFNQPGTPKVSVELEYDVDNQQAEIVISQNCFHPKTKEAQEPFHIPLFVEFLDREGNVLVSKHLIELKESFEIFNFDEIKTRPIPVFLHNFSAPVHLEYNYSDEELEIILQFEQDAFARNEAGRIYLNRVLANAYGCSKRSELIDLPVSVIDFYVKVLSSDKISVGTKNSLLTLPSIYSIVEKDEVYDFKGAIVARNQVMKQLAVALEPLMLEILENYPDPALYDPESIFFKDEMAIRTLRNSCYAYLVTIPESKYYDKIINDYENAKNFNNQFALLDVIVEMDDPRKDVLLDAFFQKWKNDETIVCNWIDIQTAASNCNVDTLDKICNTEGFLNDHPDHMRSLIRTFTRNLSAYHDDAANSYSYVTDVILEFGKINPSVASHYLAGTAYKDYAKLPAELKGLMEDQLERLRAPSIDLELRSVAMSFLEG